MGQGTSRSCGVASLAKPGILINEQNICEYPWDIRAQALKDEYKDIFLAHSNTENRAFMPVVSIPRGEGAEPLKVELELFVPQKLTDGGDKIVLLTAAIATDKRYAAPSYTSHGRIARIRDMDCTADLPAGSEIVCEEPPLHVLGDTTGYVKRWLMLESICPPSQDTVCYTFAKLRHHMDSDIIPSDGGGPYDLVMPFLGLNAAETTSMKDVMQETVSMALYLAQTMPADRLAKIRLAVPGSLAFMQVEQGIKREARAFADIDALPKLSAKGHYDIDVARHVARIKSWTLAFLKDGTREYLREILNLIVNTHEQSAGANAAQPEAAHQLAFVTVKGGAGLAEYFVNQWRDVFPGEGVELSTKVMLLATTPAHNATVDQSTSMANKTAGTRRHRNIITTKQRDHLLTLVRLAHKVNVPADAKYLNAADTLFCFHSIIHILGILSGGKSGHNKNAISISYSNSNYKLAGEA